MVTGNTTEDWLVRACARERDRSRGQVLAEHARENRLSSHTIFKASPMRAKITMNSILTAQYCRSGANPSPCKRVLSLLDPVV
jgi:hypothetical protein